MRHSKLVGAVSNCAASTYHGTYTVRLKTAPTGGESVHLFLESTIKKIRLDSRDSWMSSRILQITLAQLFNPTSLDSLLASLAPIQGLQVGCVSALQPLLVRDQGTSGYLTFSGCQ